MKIEVVKNILESNDRTANEVMELLMEKKIYALNLLSSAGSGKTTLLENIIPMLKQNFRIAVIEGDLFTTADAERIDKLGIPVVQINTEGGCHLDAYMIKDALLKFNLDEIDFVIIENVGNLVCPAEFYVGEDEKMALLTVTEGNDKPAKYPLIFEKSSVVVLNKCDLIEYTNFSKTQFEKDIASINPKAITFSISAINQDTLHELADYITAKVRTKNESSL